MGHHAASDRRPRAASARQGSCTASWVAGKATDGARGRRLHFSHRQGALGRAGGRRRARIGLDGRCGRKPVGPCGSRAGYRAACVHVKLPVALGVGWEGRGSELARDTLDAIANAHTVFCSVLFSLEHGLNGQAPSLQAPSPPLPSSQPPPTAPRLPLDQKGLAPRPRLHAPEQQQQRQQQPTSAHFAAGLPRRMQEAREKAQPPPPPPLHGRLLRGAGCWWADVRCRGVGRVARGMGGVLAWRKYSL